MGETTRLTPCVFGKNIRLTPLFWENCNLAYPLDFLNKQKLQGLWFFWFLGKTARLTPCDLFWENCNLAYPFHFLKKQKLQGLPLVIFKENYKAYPLWFLRKTARLTPCDFYDFGENYKAYPLWFLKENYKAYPLWFLKENYKACPLWIFKENYKAYPLWFFWFFFFFFFFFWGGGGTTRLTSPCDVFGEKNTMITPCDFILWGKLQGLPLVFFEKI